MTTRGGKLQIDSYGKNTTNCLENGWQHTYMHILGGKEYYKWCARKQEAYNRIGYNVDGKQTTNNLLILIN